MLADELIKSAEKMLSGFDEATKEMAPYIERMFNKIASKNDAFDAQKKMFSKDIDCGARTTKHRLHL